MPQIIRALFAPIEFPKKRNVPARICRWHDVSLPERGTISILDGRGIEDSAAVQVRDELKFQSADVIFFLQDEQRAHELEKREFDDLIRYVGWNNSPEGDAKIIGIIIPPTGRPIASNYSNGAAIRLKSALRSSPTFREHVLEVLSLPLADCAGPMEVAHGKAEELMSILAPDGEAFR